MGLFDCSTQENVWHQNEFKDAKIIKQGNMDILKEWAFHFPKQLEHNNIKF